MAHMYGCVHVGVDSQGLHLPVDIVQVTGLLVADEGCHPDKAAMVGDGTTHPTRLTLLLGMSVALWKQNTRINQKCKDFWGQNHKK